MRTKTGMELVVLYFACVGASAHASAHASAAFAHAPSCAASSACRTCSVRAGTCSVRANMILLPRPKYAPNMRSGANITGASVQVVNYLRTTAETAKEATEQHCSCDDVIDLQRSIAKLHANQCDITRRMQRLEFVMAELLSTMQSSDDMALLEKKTCTSMVYNEQLTSQRPLRLLRHELQLLQKKWSL
jgi:hypothetical protein